MCKTKEEKAQEKRIVDATKVALQETRHHINDLLRGKIEPKTSTFDEVFDKQIKSKKVGKLLWKI